MNTSKDPRNVAHHILPTSANLLGICFLIFSLVHRRGEASESLIDDFCAFAIFVFLIASIFSYMSLRQNQNARLERVADISFILGLCTLVAATALITFKYIT